MKDVLFQKISVPVIGKVVLVCTPLPPSPAPPPKKTLWFEFWFIDPLHKWCQDFNESTLYILSLVRTFADEGFLT